MRLRLFCPLLLLVMCCTPLWAHTVRIMWVCNPDGSITFYAATDHYSDVSQAPEQVPIGGITIDGIKHEFTTLVNDLPAGVTEGHDDWSDSRIGESNVIWQVVTVPSLTASGQSIFVTSESAVEMPDTASTFGPALQPIALTCGTANQDPIADAGPDRTVPLPADACEVEVALDGSASSDPDGDTLSHTWTDAGGTVVGTGDAPTVILMQGVHGIVLTVDDGNGGTDTDDVVIRVVDVTAPAVALLGDASITVECGGSFTDPGATASDACDGDLTGQIVVAGSVDAGTPGTYTITYSATDAAGNTGSAVRTVEVVDTTPPSVSCSVANDDLWPPEHQMVDVGLQFAATDLCGVAAIDISVTQDEHVDELGDGAFVPDAELVTDASGAISGLLLRAERSGTGDGRVYLIRVTAADPAGNEASAWCTVVVGKSMSRKDGDAVAAQAEAAEAAGTPLEHDSFGLDSSI